MNIAIKYRFFILLIIDFLIILLQIYFSATWDYLPFFFFFFSLFFFFFFLLFFFFFLCKTVTKSLSVFIVVRISFSSSNRKYTRIVLIYVIFIFELSYNSRSFSININNKSAPINVREIIFVNLLVLNIVKVHRPTKRIIYKLCRYT